MRKTFTLIIILSIFFILGTATSEDPVTLEYECIVEFVDGKVIIISESKININDAKLSLSTFSQTEDGEAYFRTGYALGGLAIDTIPVHSFLSSIDSVPFPNASIPSKFLMEFYQMDTLYIKEQDF